MLERVWEKGNPQLPLVLLQICPNILGNSVEISLKSKNKSIIRPGYTTPWCMSKGQDTLLNRSLLIHVYCYSSHNIQEMKATKMSFNQGIDNENVV